MLIARIVTSIAVSCLLFVDSAVATDGHHHLDARTTQIETPQERHVHGVATLFIILDGVQLDIELLSPAVNILGFEGPAINHAQQITIEKARHIMSQSQRLFQMESATCQLISHRVDFGNTLTVTDHLDNQHNTHDAKSDTEGHNDFGAHYQFHCNNNDQLSSLSTSILTEFSGIQSLQVQWIVNDRQGSALLDNGQSHVIFR